MTPVQDAKSSRPLQNPTPNAKSEVMPCYVCDECELRRTKSF